MQKEKEWSGWDLSHSPLMAVIDRSAELRSWVQILPSLVCQKYVSI